MAGLTWRLLLLASLSAAVLRQAQLCADRSRWRRVMTLHVAADDYTHTFSPLSFPDCVRACTELSDCRMFGHSSGDASCWLYDHWVGHDTSGAAVPDTRYWGLHCPESLNYTLTSGVCLKKVAILKNWTEARDYCRDEGGDLFVADSEEKLHVLQARKEYIKGLSHIGGNREGGVWRWLNGKPVQGESWLGLHQNDIEKGCLLFLLGRLYAGACEMERHFICELQP